jgi:hypothetical protein
VIFKEEVCIEYQVSSRFSAKTQTLKIFPSFRAPKISLTQRIEKLGTLPLYSTVDFSIFLRNHEDVNDYIILRPRNFSNFTDEMVQEIFDLHQSWIERRDIYSSDFLEREEIMEINQMLKYLGKCYPLQCQNYIVQVPRKSGFEFPVILDNLYSSGEFIFCI